MEPEEAEEGGGGALISGDVLSVAGEQRSADTNYSAQQNRVKD